MSDTRPEVEYIKLGENKYPIAFNLNVIDELQDKFDMPIDLFLNKLQTDKKFTFKAIRGLITSMINEAYEIENDNLPYEKQHKLLRDHEIGRILNIETIKGLKAQIMAYTLSTLPKSSDNTPS